MNLDLGCGINPLKNRYNQYKDYIGIDIIEHPNVDIIWDLRKGIPYKDESIDNIVSVEFIEHLELPDIYRLLKECYRVLVPNGTLFITCPNFEGSVHLLHQGKYYSYVIYNILGQGQTPYDYHRSLLWPSMIIEELKSVGFSNVKDVALEQLDMLREDVELKAKGITPEDFIQLKIYVRGIK
jgi:predicted SAM-dependent methyltransferase